MWHKQLFDFVFTFQLAILALCLLFTVSLFTVLKTEEYIFSHWLHASEDHGWTSGQVPLENGSSGISGLVLRDYEHSMW